MTDVWLELTVWGKSQTGRSPLWAPGTSMECVEELQIKSSTEHAARVGGTNVSFGNDKKIQYGNRKLS